MKKFKKIIFISGLVALLSSCTPVIVGISKTYNGTNSSKVVDPEEIKDVEITFHENGGVIEGLKSIKTKSNVKFKDIPNVPIVSKEGVSGQPGWYYKDSNNQKVVVTDETNFLSLTLYYLQTGNFILLDLNQEQVISLIDLKKKYLIM